MLRHLVYAAFVAAFAVFTWHGIAGWSHPATDRPHGTGSLDETPLMIGRLSHDEMHKLAMMGYPWQRFEPTIVVLKRDLPPDPAVPTAEDQRKDNERPLPDFKLPLPAGRMTWPQILGRMRAGLAPLGIKVTTAEPSPPESLFIEVPPNDWVANESLFHVRELSQRAIVALVTSEGLAIGTDAAVNKLAIDAKLQEVRRRVAPEHADPALDAEFTPDLVQASVVALSRAIEGQTGVEVVMEEGLWDAGIGVIWRGQPRKLRDALDEFTSHSQMRCYWRFRDGRAWVLKPQLP